MNRNTLKKAYRDLIDECDDPKDMEAHLKFEIERSRQQGFGELKDVAYIIAHVALAEYGVITFKTTDESREWGAFLTGGHHFHDYSKANAWLEAHGLGEFKEGNAAY